MKPPVAEADLTFSTPDDSGFPYVLFLCVLGSFLAHAATFVLFQVVYPQRVTIPQPAPRVSLLTPSTPENVALLRWIEAEDPALVANDNLVSPSGLVDVRYRPSFAVPRTAPLGVPVDQTTAVQFPRAAERLSVLEPPADFSQPPAPARAAGSTITFSGTLAARPLAKSGPISFRYHAREPADSTTLLIGVNDRGEVRFSMLQRSSGNADLDEVALAATHQLAFGQAEPAMTWGFATFSWGSDAYAVPVSSP